MSTIHQFMDRIIAIDNRPAHAARELVHSWLCGPDGEPEPVHESWGPRLKADVAAERERRGLKPAPTMASHHRSRLPKAD